LAFRAVAWFWIFAIIILSVVPASERPVTGTGQWLEHFTAFVLVGSTFAIAHRLSLMRLFIMAFLFCGGIELLQVPLPTRHARVSDFVIDCFGSWFGIGLIWIGGEFLSKRTLGDLHETPAQRGISTS
jgi:VanZ family protein